MRISSVERSAGAKCSVPLWWIQQFGVRGLEFRVRGFRFALNEDAMATKKMAKANRKFAADPDSLSRSSIRRTNWPQGSPWARELLNSRFAAV
jgi:hypothetical protein